MFFQISLKVPLLPLMEVQIFHMPVPFFRRLEGKGRYKGEKLCQMFQTWKLK